MKLRPAGSILLLICSAAGAIGLLSVRPAEVVPLDGPVDSFSAERARRHLEAIAGEPRPAGSEAHERTRAYIATEIEALGLRPMLQEGLQTRILDPRRVSVATVVNILTRIEGREDGPALLVVAHYDSVPGSPGAGDDGSGVAVLLEGMRVLREGARLRNDVIFLFTDGEESGLFGAREFVDRHPWFDDVGMVLNFEAAGTGGPSLMFETSDGNGRLISEFRHVVPRPFAASYSYELYRVMPNDTDFTIFRRAGLPGLNFAFIHGPTGYHTPLDNLERIDPGSVQHHGDALIQLARRFGEADLDTSWETGDAIYFDLAGVLFVRYPAAAAIPVAAVLGVVVLLFLAAGFRLQRLSHGRLWLGLAVQLAAAALIGGLLHLAAPLLVSRYNFSIWGGSSGRALSLLAVGGVAAALALALQRELARRIGPDNLFASGLLAWWILTLTVSTIAPGASYLFAVPLLVALIITPGWREAGAAGGVGSVALTVAAGGTAVVCLVWVPTLAMIAVALGPGAPLPMGIFVTLLLLGPLAVYVERDPSPSRIRVPVGILAVTVVLLAAVRLASVHGAANPRFDGIIYALDNEAGEAWWVSLDRGTDAWTSHFLTETPEEGRTPDFLGYSRRALLSAAPVAKLDSARIEPFASSVGAGRPGAKSFRVEFPYRAHRALLEVVSVDGIRALTIGGRRVELETDRVQLFISAPPTAGLELSVETGGPGPVEVEAVGQRYELPALAGFSIPPRPAGLVRRPGWSIDSTFVKGAPVTIP